MIERYTRKEMGQLWSQTTKYATWLEVELAAAQAWQEKENLMTGAQLDEIRQKARFDVSRIDELELQLKHDVIAFLENVNEHVGPLGRFIHYGMTSSDVLDTSYALLMTRALDQIMVGLNQLMTSLKKQAQVYKDTVQIGRSHGIHAEPTTFGLKLALYYDELRRDRKRLQQARDGIAFGKLSGAVGTYAHLPPKVEARACEILGLKPVHFATQVIQRDRHAEVFCQLAILGGTLEKIAVEIRHLQRTELREAEEPFTKGQKGSSAMPHKRNPIASENVTGCARLLRSYAQAALENIALWHERDISHSSVERVISPDATILADYMLHRMNAVIKDLVVYPEHMQENLQRSKGLIFSQKLMLELVKSGRSRESAYALVQKNAMRVWDENGTFKSYVTQDPEITKSLDHHTLDSIFNIETYIWHRDEIFKRIFED